MPSPPSPARRVEVAAERVERWLAGFAARHGPLTEEAGERAVRWLAADGAVAEATVPFPPLSGSLVEHVGRDRTVGVLLVRLGGYAAGVFDGTALTSSKVGSRPVHGRSAAGGQSQRRFARRREGQAKVALAAAADAAARILLPELPRLEAVVTGGDRTALTAVLADRRLAALVPLVQERVLDVPDPRLAVLRRAAERYRAVPIRVWEPAP